MRSLQNSLTPQRPCAEKVTRKVNCVFTLEMVSDKLNSKVHPHQWDAKINYGLTLKVKALDVGF